VARVLLPQPPLVFATNTLRIVRSPFQGVEFCHENLLI
jgi:hypothetical protein